MQKRWAQNLRNAGLEEAEIVRVLGVSLEWLRAL
jgi:hypothetical protein